MTDYRALTQGGIIAGSQNCDGEGTWTCPARVTRIFFQYDHYFKVTPGTTYKYAGYSYVDIGRYVPGTGRSGLYNFSMSGRTNIFYWSNDINAHNYNVDLDNYTFSDA